MDMKINGKLIIALARSYKTIHEDSDKMLKTYGLTSGQFAVLEALYSKGELSVSELIEKVLTTSGNMTVLISNLEKVGYVVRNRDEKDKRSYLINLTQEGANLTEEVFPKHMKCISNKLSGLSRIEKQSIVDLLKKIE